MPSSPCSSSGRAIDDDRRLFLYSTYRNIIEKQERFRHSSREEGTNSLLALVPHAYAPNVPTLRCNTRELEAIKSAITTRRVQSLSLSLTHSSPPIHLRFTSLFLLPLLSSPPLLDSPLPTKPVSRCAAVSTPCDRPHIPAAGCATHTIHPPTHSYQQAQLKVLRSFIWKLIRTNAPSTKTRNAFCSNIRKRFEYN